MEQAAANFTFTTFAQIQSHRGTLFLARLASTSYDSCRQVSGGCVPLCFSSAVLQTFCDTAFTSSDDRPYNYPHCGSRHAQTGCAKLFLQHLDL